jgi:hypothetical protein
VPHRIGRHVHPDASPETATVPPAATGIDYLALVAAQHREQLAERINYTDLSSTRSEQADLVNLALKAEPASVAAARQPCVTVELPGQLDLTDLTDDALEQA